MGVDSHKHEIKTLFLIINSCIALTIGILPLAIAVGMALCDIWEHVVMFGNIAVGTLILGFASLGYYGAISEKGATLRVYAAVMGLVTMVEVVAVLKMSGLRNYIGILTYGIFHTALTLSALTLAMILAKQARRIYPVVPTSLVATPTAPIAL